MPSGHCRNGIAWPRWAIHISNTDDDGDGVDSHCRGGGYDTIRFGVVQRMAHPVARHMGSKDVTKSSATGKTVICQHCAKSTFIIRAKQYTTAKQQKWYSNERPHANYRFFFEVNSHLKGASQERLPIRDANVRQELQIVRLPSEEFATRKADSRNRMEKIVNQLNRLKRTARGNPHKHQLREHAEVVEVYPTPVKTHENYGIFRRKLPGWGHRL